ncbi:MAG TPA: DUF1587 domain-containing protein, partial [Gammaproteobacteria bacterium]|nr:DUF1587 domain-containing protein [Gammaproteobacteria bacterium]
MKALTGIAAGGAVAALGVTLWHLNPTPEAQLRENWVMLERYCVDCHNDAELTGGISFEGADPENIHSNPEMFEAAIRKLRVGMMPPRTEPQPAPELRTAFLTSLESTLDAAAQAQPFAGTKPVHRLNRAEYANAVRDLLGVTVDVSELLPSDGGDFGFDNIAAALTTSPFLLERYLTAAQRIGALALGDPEAVPTAAAYKIGVEVTQNQYMEGLPLGTRGGTAVTHIFPADAEYEFSGRLLRTVAEGYVGVEGHAQPHEFVITIDGDQVYSAMIGGPEDHELSSQDIVESRVAVDARMTSPRIAVTAGPHEIGFTWTDRPGVEQNIWQPSLRNTQEAHNPAGLPRLETVSVAGPFDVTGVSDTPARERI